MSREMLTIYDAWVVVFETIMVAIVRYFTIATGVDFILPASYLKLSVQ